MDEDALSPVIGIILMIAITVVMGAIVFVMIGETGDGGDAPPAYAFQKNENGDHIAVVTAPGTSSWDDIRLRSDHELRYALNGAPGLLSTQVPADSPIQLSETDSVDATDELRFCGSNGVLGQDQAGVTVILIDVDSGRMVYKETFATISACL